MFFLGMWRSTSIRTAQISGDLFFRKSLRGFTVLELLVVVAIMAVMMGLLGFTMIGGNTKGLETAQRQVFNLLHFTRVTAMSSGAEARFLVNSDTEDSEKYLRHIQVVVKDLNQTAGWRVVNEGEYLPEGVWFVPANSSIENWPEDGYSSWSEDEDVDFQLGTLIRGIRMEDSDGTPHFLISFGASGLAVSKDMPRMPRLVLAKGELKPIGNLILPQFTNSFEIAGVLIQPFGGMLALEYQDFIL